LQQAEKLLADCTAQKTLLESDLANPAIFADAAKFKQAENNYKAALIKFNEANTNYESLLEQVMLREEELSAL
jgi:cytochrome c556